MSRTLSISSAPAARPASAASHRAHLVGSAAMIAATPRAPRDSRANACGVNCGSPAGTASAPQIAARDNTVSAMRTMIRQPAADDPESRRRSRDGTRPREPTDSVDVSAVIAAAEGSLDSRPRGAIRPAYGWAHDCSRSRLSCWSGRARPPGMNAEHQASVLHIAAVNSLVQQSDSTLGRPQQNSVMKDEEMAGIVHSYARALPAGT